MNKWKVIGFLVVVGGVFYAWPFIGSVPGYLYALRPQPLPIPTREYIPQQPTAPLPPTQPPVLTTPTRSLEQGTQPTPVVDYQATRDSEAFATHVAISVQEQERFLATVEAEDRQIAIGEAAVVEAESPLLLTGDMMLTEGIRVMGALMEPGSEGSYELTNGLWVKQEFAEFLANCGYNQAQGLRTNTGCPPNAAAYLPAGR